MTDQPMKAGDRVWLVEDIHQHNRIVIGTVKKVSQMGYVHVMYLLSVGRHSRRRLQEREKLNDAAISRME